MWCQLKSKETELKFMSYCNFIVCRNYHRALTTCGLACCSLFRYFKVVNVKSCLIPFKTMVHPPMWQKKIVFHIFKPFVVHIWEHSLPESLNIIHCWHTFYFKHLGLLKIRSEGHCKVAELTELALISI